jgi:hypothetical protein
VTEVEKLPHGTLTTDLEGHEGSMVSVREADDADRMDFTDEELDLKEEVIDIGDSKLQDRPLSEAGSYTRSVSPYGEDSYAGSVDGDGIGKKKRKRRKERANVVTPVNNDADMSVSDEIPSELKKKGPSEAWSMSSMHNISEIPVDAPPERPKSSGITRAKSPQTRNRSPGVGAHSASASRAQSVISVREADENQRVGGLHEAGESRNKTRPTEHRNDEDHRSIVSGTTSPLLKPPQLEHEQQAYVPYMYARDCLAKVMDDMKKMKVNHLRIVGQIGDTYKMIEDETQTQFNMFVAGLRVQYKDKVKTFRQVIEIHREDFGSHKSYWEETIKSLNAKNKALMKEKKKLLIINKIEIDRLEKEKVSLSNILHLIHNEILPNFTVKVLLCRNKIT